MAEFCTPDELVARWIEPEDHVHLASTMSRPNALIRVLARTLAGRASLTVSANAIHAMGHCLTMAGVVGRARTAFVGDTIPSPRPNFRGAIPTPWRRQACSHSTFSSWQERAA